MTRMADWAEPIQVEHMYRELFGSTLMLVDQARWDDGSLGTAAETMKFGLNNAYVSDFLRKPRIFLAGNCRVS